MGIISRRSFLKRSSVAGLAAATAVPGMKVLAAEGNSSKSRVVMITDDECYSPGSVDEKKVAEMVLNGVKTLTGETDIGKAFEALFPGDVTKDTKIILKRNDLSGTKADFATTDKAITGAFKDGLTKMLDGTFPSGNVDIHCRGGSMLSKITAADYIINCPVCSCHGSDYGVTLSCKNTMIYLDRASKFHSANKKWLHEVSLDEKIKPKQVLSVMNAVVGNNKSGPMNAPNIQPKTIIMSKDIIAVDYQTLRVMENNGSPSTSRVATGDKQLEAAEAAGLGTCTPEKMDVIELKPPYTTGILKEHNPLVRQLSVTVLDKKTHYEFSLPTGSSHGTEMSVFDMKGALVWRTRSENVTGINWYKNTASGGKVPAGSYTYRIKQGRKQIGGVVLISR